VALQLLGRGHEEAAALGLGVDVHERRQRSHRPLGRVEDASRRVGVREVVLVPRRAELRGDFLGLRAPALAGIVRQVTGERERPPIPIERERDRRSDPGSSRSPGNKCGDHRGRLIAKRPARPTAEHGPLAAARSALFGLPLREEARETGTRRTYNAGATRTPITAAELEGSMPERSRRQRPADF
jgi:hypothetical protein